jgi:DNA-binding response OmpR family regulator
MEVLIVHAHALTRKTIVRLLAERRHRSVLVSSMAEGEAQLAASRWDLVILSQAFDDGDAITFLQRARRRGRTVAIAVVESVLPIAQQIALLHAGMDQVLESSLTPRETRELVIRLEALVRRSWQMPVPRRIDVGGLAIDEARSTIETPEGDIPIAPGELKVIALLAERTGTVVTRGELNAAVAGESAEFSDNALESIMKRLRIKVPALRHRLRSMRHRGYMLAPPTS